MAKRSSMMDEKGMMKREMSEKKMEMKKHMMSKEGMNEMMGKKRGHGKK